MVLLKDNLYQPQSFCSDNGLNTKNVKRPLRKWQTRAGMLNDACGDGDKKSNKAVDVGGNRKSRFTVQCGLEQILEQSVQCCVYSSNFSLRFFLSFSGLLIFSCIHKIRHKAHCKFLGHS